MKILYYNNCWFTNVGESFIDIGALNIIPKIWDCPKIACVSDMGDWYSAAIEKKQKRIFMKRSVSVKTNSNLYENLSADYVVMAGMFATEAYLDSPGRIMIDYLVNNGVKLVLLGLGAEKYTTEEKDRFEEYLQKVKPSLIVTRDKQTYELYKNQPNIIEGLDCAFWVKDSFDPRGFVKEKYDIHAFNRSQKPNICSDKGLKIINPWHMQWYCRSDDLEENYLLSDSPFDYLTAYANANKVYTDLVHATIPSLQYGVPVKYYYVDKRSSAFDAVECIKVDSEGFMLADEQKLEMQKDRIIENIRLQLFEGK